MRAEGFPPSTTSTVPQNTIVPPKRIANAIRKYIGLFQVQGVNGTSLPIGLTPALSTLRWYRHLAFFDLIRERRITIRLGSTIGVLASTTGSLIVEFAFLRGIFSWSLDGIDYIFVAVSFLDPAPQNVKPRWALTDVPTYLADPYVQIRPIHMLASADIRRLGAFSRVESASALASGFELFYRNPYVTMFY